MTNRKHAQGFTMIEITIVLLIVGIIAAVAIPSYQDSVRKGRRATAQACLTEVSQFMERFYATQLTYAGAAIPNLQCRRCGVSGTNRGIRDVKDSLSVATDKVDRVERNTGVVARAQNTVGIVRCEPEAELADIQN